MTDDTTDDTVPVDVTAGAPADTTEAVSGCFAPQAKRRDDDEDEEIRDASGRMKAGCLMKAQPARAFVKDVAKELRDEMSSADQPEAEVKAFAQGMVVATIVQLIEDGRACDAPVASYFESTLTKVCKKHKRRFRFENNGDGCSEPKRRLVLKAD